FCTPVVGVNLIGTSSATSPYSVTWSSEPADGNYSLLALVTDNAGNVATSPVATKAVDNNAPAVTLTAPANGSSTNNNKPTFSGAAGTASGDLSTITVKIYNGTGTGGTVAQTLTATASGGSWSVAPTTALADGTYTAQASQGDT